MDPSPPHSPESIACRITIFIRRWWIAGCHVGGFIDVLRTCLLIGVSSGAPKINVSGFMGVLRTLLLIRCLRWSPKITGCGRPSHPESYVCRTGPLPGRVFRLFGVGFQIQIQIPPCQGTWPTWSSQIQSPPYQGTWPT